MKLAPLHWRALAPSCFCQIMDTQWIWRPVAYLRRIQLSNYQALQAQNSAVVPHQEIPLSKPWKFEWYSSQDEQAILPFTSPNSSKKSKYLFSMPPEMPPPQGPEPWKSIRSINHFLKHFPAHFSAMVRKSLRSISSHCQLQTQLTHWVFPLT